MTVDTWRGLDWLWMIMLELQAEIVLLHLSQI